MTERLADKVMDRTKTRFVLPIESETRLETGDIFSMLKPAGHVLPQGWYYVCGQNIWRPFTEAIITGVVGVRVRDLRSQSIRALGYNSNVDFVTEFDSGMREMGLPNWTSHQMLRMYSFELVKTRAGEAKKVDAPRKDRDENYKIKARHTARR